LTYYFVWAFLIYHEPVVLSCTCHSFCAAKDKIPDLDRVELDGAIMEPCDAELVECISE